MRATPSTSHLADLVGASVATLCGLHCVAAPVLVLALPVLAGTWVVQERTEWALLAAAVLIGLASIAPATVRGHRCPWPLLLLGSGLGVLLLARLRLEEGSAANVLAVACGAALVASAHLRNRRLSMSAASGPARC